MKDNFMHWELAIEENGGTISIESFDKIDDAIKALNAHPNKTAFIDLWDGTKEMGQTLNKEQLKKIGDNHGCN